MSGIPYVELTDTFNTQRERINQIIDSVNAGASVTPGQGISVSGGTISVKKTGDGLNFDSNNNLVGNDAYPNLLTQVIIDPSAQSIVPTLVTATTITFPAFSVIFDNKVYYGTKISDFTRINVPITTMTVDEGENSSVFVYVDNVGEIHQSTTPITPANASTQCLLGSYFRLNNQIQSGSWKYTPWNGATDRATRFGSTAISGGLLSVNSTSTLRRSVVTVIHEGVNITNSLFKPNSVTYEAEAPYQAKELWPGYDASVLDSSILDTTHIYNMTNQRVDDISALSGYVVLIPGIVNVTGQDVYLMAMSPYVNSEYTQIFPDMNTAVNSIYALQFDLGTVTNRVSWLGQAIVVKIGATDFTNPEDLQIIGQLPNSLGSFVSASGSGSSTKIAGMTIKLDSTTVGSENSITTLNFEGSFSANSTSDEEVTILLDAGKILQQSVGVWPNSYDPADWPHTVLLTTGLVPSITPTYTEHILTWEVMIKNTGSSTLNLTWPSIYVGFNSEELPSTIAANTTLFLMMRKYSENYVLVSHQGTQANNRY